VLTDDLEEEICAEFIEDEQGRREVFFQFDLETVGGTCGDEGYRYMEMFLRLFANLHCRCLNLLPIAKKHLS
jgi:hypothetical protein